MNKQLLYILIFLLPLCSKAQQRPQYTQYVFNEFIINPAVAGIENYVDGKMGYRSQWTGLQGAPVTSYFTINAPIGGDFINGDATRIPPDGNSSGRAFTQTYRAAEPHHGIGLTFFSDKAGPIKQTSINASYAYHLGLTPTFNLAVGVSGGINNTSLATNEITLDDANDQAINTANNSVIKPDFTAGVWAYSSDYFVGASVQQLVNQSYSFTSNPAYTQGRTVPHFYLTGGVKFFVSDDVTVLPSVMFKIINPLPSTFDLNVKMAFRDQFWVGAAYRNSDALSAMFGFNIGSIASVGYSYDYTTSSLGTVSNGTHELVVGFYLNNRNGISSPQHFW
jgi:type IX secretion system PorP/SprF family membrane protein